MAVYLRFWQLESRWVLNYGIVAISSTFIILSPENNKLLNKIDDDI